MTGVSVAGWGSALPDGAISTHELADRFGIKESWIIDRSGIRTRRTGSTTNALAARAAAEALEDAGMVAADIAMVVVATCSPTQLIPSTAAIIQGELGIPAGAGAVDLNAACSGFVYAFAYAAGLAALGVGPTLVVGADALTCITDYDDRDTAVLFGDGAGAAVVVPVDGPGEVLALDLGNDPSGVDMLKCAVSGQIEMDGQEVFAFAVESVAASVRRIVDQAEISLDDVDLFVPHQANIRIISSAWRTLGIDMSRTALTLADTGNTGGASIPIAVRAAKDNGALKPGDIVVLTSCGAGMSWGSVALRCS